MLEWATRVARLGSLGCCVTGEVTRLPWPWHRFLTTKLMFCPKCFETKQIRNKHTHLQNDPHSNNRLESPREWGCAEPRGPGIPGHPTGEFRKRFLGELRSLLEGTLSSTISIVTPDMFLKPRAFRKCPETFGTISSRVPRSSR